MKKFNLKLFVFSLIIPLLVGGLATLLIKDNLNIYQEINKPVFAPPGWLFGPVWTVLYILMGVSFYLILNSGKEKKDAVYYFILQLIFNFVWPIIFFNLNLFWVAFVWIIGLIYLIIRMIKSFYDVNKVAGILQFPYLFWTIFAGILNIAIAILN